MPLQTPSSAATPLPVDMPADNGNETMPSPPSIDGIAVPDTEEARILKEKQDSATVPQADTNLAAPTSTDGSALKLPTIPEFNVPGAN